MKRLTTDHPENNFETALNFVYGKDGVAYLRSGSGSLNLSGARNRRRRICEQEGNH